LRHYTAEEVIIFENYRDLRIHGLTQCLAKLVRERAAPDRPSWTASEIRRSMRQGARISRNTISCMRPDLP